MKDLEVNTDPLRDVFSKGTFLSIPYYQRLFSWDTSNFEDLIDDLTKADHSQDYFLGTAVLQKVKDPSSFEVVDGQQRFTSIMILLACLRDRIEDRSFAKGIHDKIVQEESEVDSIPEEVRLTVKDSDIYREIVITEGGTLDLSKLQGLSEPESRYVVATQVFSAKLDEMSQDQLKAFSKFLSQRCLIITLSTPSFEDAFRLFTIVNDRGKQLRRIDVLKAHNLSPALIPNEKAREKLSSQWETYENEIGEDRFESIANLLRLTVLKDKPQYDLLREFTERVFGKKLILPGEQFVTRLFKFVDLYQSIFIDRDFCDKGGQPNLPYRALIHIMDNEFKASEWRACLLLYASKFGSKGFEEFLQGIEKHFLGHFVTGMRKDERYSEYAKLLAVIDAAKTPKLAVDALDWDEDEILDAVCGQILYGRSYAKYALLRLELLACEHDRLHEFTARSIEHVWPQDPADDSEWVEKDGSDEMIEFVHSVGNLVLLSKSKNSSASNLDFENKKDRYLRSRVSDYPRSIDVLRYKHWGRSTIEKRTREVRKVFLKDIIPS